MEENEKSKQFQNIRNLMTKSVRKNVILALKQITNKHLKSVSSCYIYNIIKEKQILEKVDWS
jgi:hypothetical protein